MQAEWFASWPYAFGAYDAHTSPRLILVARKAATRLFPLQLAADSADGLRRQAQV